MRQFIKDKPFTFGWILGYLISIPVGLVAWLVFGWPGIASADAVIAVILAYIAIAAVVVKAFREWR